MSQVSKIYYLNKYEMLISCLFIHFIFPDKMKMNILLTYLLVIKYMNIYLKVTITLF